MTKPLPILCAAAVVTAATLYATGLAQDEPPAAPTLPTFGQADNSLCMVCHIDFQEEELTVKHLAKGITCAACHGACVAHMHDEMLNTKPDILYGRAEIDGFCRPCHLTHKDPDKVQAFRDEWAGQHRPSGRYIAEDSPCTDCHGMHVIIK